MSVARGCPFTQVVAGPRLLGDAGSEPCAMREGLMDDQANARHSPHAAPLGSIASCIRDPTYRAVILELALIALWALWVGRAYLDFDVSRVPAGREYGSVVQSHHLWTRLRECGWCALWNGSERGGAPAFVNVYGSALHPLVALTTLLFGVVNGSKVALIATLWIAGLAQWYLARVLRLGWLARLWSGLAAVVGGHLATRMELGLFGVILSTATCSLVFAPALKVARDGGRRSTVLLSITLALAIVAGQGYLQIGLIFLSPAFLLLMLDGDLRLRPSGREYAIAIGLALLMAAPLLVPLAHFWPNFSKDMDWNLSAAQPLKYFVLNFIINDRSFLLSEALGKLPQAASYSMYIGWLPILLAFLCLRLARPEDQKNLLFLAVSAALALLTGSAVTLRWLQPIFPSVAGIRFPSLIGGLAVPPVLGLAAYGLDRLFSANWPRLSIGYHASRERRHGVFSLRWLLLIPLACSLQAGYNFSREWLHVTELGDDASAILNALRTPNLQWVEPPFGEHFFIEPAIRMGLKLSPGIRPWHWKNRTPPEPYLEASRQGAPPKAYQVGTVKDVPIYRFNDNREYAFVRMDDSVIPCRAAGRGGNLSVRCAAPEAGELVVRENSWNGWYAWRDGARVRLLQARWLSVDAPAGEHQYRFRYLPWDVALGILLSLLGITLSIWQWQTCSPPQTASRRRSDEGSVLL